VAGLLGVFVVSMCKQVYDTLFVIFRQKVHQVLGNAAIRRTHCVVDVAAHRTISRSRNVHSVDTPVVN